MNRHIQIIVILLFITIGNISAQEKFNVTGKVISASTREPVGFATVSIKGSNALYSIADSAGVFLITEVPAGIYRIEVSSLGYITTTSPEFIVSGKTRYMEIPMEEDIAVLDGVTVRSTVLERVKDAGIGKQIIGVADIEKIPGGNRDISRVIRTYPGVGYSPVGYRNDLIVRGGSPAENAFYVDGIEIPNINHFSTQGASGGPVGIINADLIEQVQFYTGALPVAQGGVLSSVMDIKLKNGNLNDNIFKATIGASEVGISGSGHFGEKTTWLFSARQSYLQLLFKMLELPFLPNYIDGQIKVNHRISDKDEIIIMALGGIDRMKLNTELEGEEAEYLLGYLPVIRQNTYTVGASYTHYGEKGRYNLSINYNCLENSNIKYSDNDSSNEANLMFKYDSKEEKIGIRNENRFNFGRWQLLAGVQASYVRYYMDSFEKGNGNYPDNYYTTELPVFSCAIFTSASYESYNKRFNARVGVRGEWKNLSPRVQVSYALLPQLSINGNIGIYHQKPPYTALGYKEDGEYINKDLKDMRVMEGSVGARWNLSEKLVFSLEGFYKRYSNMPLSIRDGIPLACKGNDYGIVGNEPLVSAAEGRAYGAELSARWIIAGKLNFIGSATLYSSEYRSDKGGEYYPSAWDNRFILNAGGTYNLPRNWSIGGKLSCIGGAPYTPYDEAKSAQREAWDAQGKPYPDYSKYNSLRLAPFAQLDIRADKNWYFKGWMLGAYIDLQNITASKLKQQDVIVSTGEIMNPTAPISEQIYTMKKIKQEAGTIIPTIGLTVEF